MADSRHTSSVPEGETPPPASATRRQLRESSRVSKRAHVKTRTGCGTCKRRKIKCDEHRPSCRNCTKHDVACDFIQSAHSTPPIIVQPAAIDAPLNMLDLELLHNFTISTYATLSTDTAIRGLWKTGIVRLATKCDYVMRSILAVSALHIAQHRPAQQDYYVAHGLLHHQVASRAAIALMENPDAENYEALWVFSVLTIYFALGSPKESSTSLFIGESSFPDWLFLLNGVRHILECLQSRTYTGLLSPMLILGGRRWQASHEAQHTKSNLLRDLEEQVLSTPTDDHLLPIYKEAIAELRCQLSFVLSSENQALDIMDAFVWQFTMAKTFLPLLKIPTQEAVAIFAHYCIVLNRLEGNRWLQGWSVCLISRACELLDAEHRTWIHWPIEEIGWVPS